MENSGAVRWGEENGAAGMRLARALVQVFKVLFLDDLRVVRRHVYECEIVGFTPTLIGALQSCVKVVAADECGGVAEGTTAVGVVRSDDLPDLLEFCSVDRALIANLQACKGAG